MKILLVAATASEIEPLLSHFNIIENGGTIKGNSLDILVTGVGMTATAFAMGRALGLNQYDLAINAGIAGAFDRSLKTAEVVAVTLDCFAELGAEDGEDFLTIDELGFGRSSVKPEHTFEHRNIDALKKAKGITVNKVHGNDESIYTTVTRLNPQVESMEGAAFFYACNQSNLPCLQVRAISNYVERRNRDTWKIPLAIQNLNAVLIELLNDLP
ncbi:futalosine hydrolase [Paradesertivirga mongoliensis]|uniref:Futalosine hydrolase n=1 Tax=Paradesertivirga mongoliensis TaxID=2100740 RepID=A0ABW4ZIZ3_9SPHI|nr:futalosine hydrolase [Pedobacter mongoliensis]